ncbi:hypothetical protein V8G54_001459 [Vigna mungo]|uniref:Uncharacterized protein n=1 Tax=Vigna mungo TaxID=3915 RepID=A0AAQ3P890_VIGMU
MEDLRASSLSNLDIVFPSLLLRRCSASLWQLLFSHAGTRDSFKVVCGGGACDRHSGRGATLEVSMVVRAVCLERQVCGDRRNFAVIGLGSLGFGFLFLDLVFCRWRAGLMVRLLRPGSSLAKDGASSFFLQWRSLVFVFFPFPSIWFDAGEMRGLATCLRSSPTMEPRRFLRSVMDKPLSFSGAAVDGDPRAADGPVWEGSIRLNRSNKADPILGIFFGLDMDQISFLIADPILDH